MKTFLLPLVTALLYLPASAQMAGVAAETDSITTVTASAKITGSFEMNYFKHYLWRGALFGNNDVAQPELELNYKSLTLTLAQNLNYAPAKVPKEYYTRNAVFDEQDVAVSYTAEWGRFTSSFSAMAYFYFFQRNTPNTAELYNRTDFAINKTLSAFTEASVDVAAYRGAFYSNTGLAATRHVHGISLEGTAYVALANATFNGTYYGTNKGGFNLVGGTLAATKTFGGYYVKTFAERNQYVNSRLRNFTGLPGTGNFGVAAGVAF